MSPELLPLDRTFDALVRAGFSKRDAGLFCEGAADMARQLAAQLAIGDEEATALIAESSWRVHNGEDAHEIRKEIEARYAKR